jgi:WD40 repeat protein
MSAALPDPVEYVAWSPDGSRIAAATPYGVLGVWDAHTGSLIRTWDNAPDEARHAMYELLWADTQLVTLQDSIGITAWDVDAGQVLRTIPGYYVSLNWLPGTDLLVGILYSIDFFHLTTGERADTIDLRGEWGEELIVTTCGGAVRPDQGEYAATVSVSTQDNSETTVQTISWVLGEAESDKYFIHSSDTRCTAPFWSPDGTLFSLVNGPGVEFWTQENPTTRRTTLGTNEGNYAWAWSPGQTRLASITNGVVRLYGIPNQ